MTENRGSHHRNLYFPVKGLPEPGVPWVHIYKCEKSPQNFLVDNNILYVCDDNKFLAIDILTQEILWRVELPLVRPSIPFSMNSTSIIQGCYNGAVICLDKQTGATRWKRDFVGFEARYSLIAMDSFALCIMHQVAKHPQLVCMDLDSGDILWTYRCPETGFFGNDYSHLMHDNGTAVFSAGSALCGLSLITGKEMFFRYGGSAYGYPVMYKDWVIYLTGLVLHFFSLNTCTLVTRYEFDRYFGYKGKSGGAIVVANDIVFFGVVPGQFLSYDLKTEKPSFSPYFFTLPAAADNHLYYMHSDALYKLSLPDGKYSSYGSPGYYARRNEWNPAPPLLADEGIFVYMDSSIYRLR